MNETATSRRPITLDDLQLGSMGPSACSLSGESLLASLLNEQQQLTAVEAFSRESTRGEIPSQAKFYAKLLPASPPGPGEQYAFEVNLDRCSGCKACVTACHSLNGLDDRETWRDVGLLVGGTELLPVMQHVTAACHHCLEPACMSACPVNAYEKDPRTGIVKHLDDQCFGCQYCTLACPYGVPKYHGGKGIVRKCDMCSSRLAKGEAPACVQACPHEAIAIRIVSVQRVIEDSEADHFLPAAPDPSLTRPTTTYKTSRVFPRNMLPADYYSLSPEHPHWPLIIMLVLTQLSVGAFVTGIILDGVIDPALAAKFRPLHATLALLLGLVALLASTCHLGRPLYAFRGILGLRHSWLSREILAFGIFATLAVLYAAVCWATAAPDLLPIAWQEQADRQRPVLGLLVAAAGAAGVYCSAMIYVFTKRDLWSFERTMLRFGLTSALLGIVATWGSLMLTAWLGGEHLAGQLIASIGRPLTQVLLVVAVAKLAVDVLSLRPLADHRVTPLKRTALLLTGPLARISLARLGLGLLGGVCVPLLLIAELPAGSPEESSLPLAIGLISVGCVGGEMLERYLFFAAVSAPRMPGGVRP